MDEQQTAYHEAGHAVAFRCLFPDRRISAGVSIEPDLRAGSLGRHRAEELICSLNASDEDIQNGGWREAICLCAGWAACLAAGYPEAEWGCEQDFEDAARCSGDLAAAREQALALVRRPQNIRAVRAVAGELLRLRDIDGQVLEVLLDYAFGATDLPGYCQYLVMSGLPPTSLDTRGS